MVKIWSRLIASFPKFLAADDGESWALIGQIESILSTSRIIQTIVLYETALKR
jgi:hypothetical protein